MYRETGLSVKLQNSKKEKCLLVCVI